MGRRWGDRLWQSRSLQHLFSRPQLVCWRGLIARGPLTWECPRHAYRLQSAVRVAVFKSLMTITENCVRRTASRLIRVILIRRSPITILEQYGLIHGTGAIFNKTPYTSARVKPRRPP
jgi:hypothetical protein